MLSRNLGVSKTKPSDTQHLAAQSQWCWPKSWVKPNETMTRTTWGAGGMAPSKRTRYMGVVNAAFKAKSGVKSSDKSGGKGLYVSRGYQIQYA